MTMLNPHDNEVAAALAAISLYLAEEAATHMQNSQEHHTWQWHASAILTTQSIPISRSIQQPTWSNIERLRRAM